MAALDDGSLPAAFGAVVERWGGRPAVIATDRTLTFADLEHASGRVAGVLIALDAPPERPVALALPVGSGQIVAMLATIRAGRPYVPLDPAWPAARRRQLVEAAGACAVVAVDPTASIPGVPSIGLDVGNPAQPVAFPRIEATAAACVLFTSGSTGSPRGVVLSHGSVRHHATTYGREAGVTADDRLSLLPSYAFGASLSDVFGALLHGAAVCPFPIRRAGFAALADWIDATGITVYHSAPTLFRELCRAVARDRVWRTLRLVKLGGEALLRDDVILFRAHCRRGAVLWNGLGATECNLIRRNLLDHDTPVTDDIVPVGYPVPGVEVAIVDEDGIDLPAGAVGEIEVRSRHLALGYWRLGGGVEPIDSATRPDGVRRHRLGDVGRLRADGCLEHLGRVDDQVKIRGHRVDPAEVEAVLATHPSVRQAVVVGHERAPGDRRLVAHVVPADPKASCEARVLRAHLRARLPAYMVPQRFVSAAALPVTSSGKVDRRALSLPAPTDAPVTPPRTEVERTVALAFAAALGVPIVGREDDFFELGGDSLAAMRLLAGIERALGREVLPETLLAAPTVSALAAVLANDGVRPVHRIVVPVQPQGEARPFYCVHPVGGHLLRFYDLARCLGDAQPFWGLQAPILSAREARRLTVPVLARRYLEALDSSGVRAPYRLGGMCLGGVIAFEMARQLRARGDDVEVLVLMDAGRVPRDPGPFRESALRLVRRMRHAARRRTLRDASRRARRLVANVRANVRTIDAGAIRPWEWRGDRQATRWWLRVAYPAARENLRLQRALVAAVRAYRVLPYPGRVVSIRGTHDPKDVGREYFDWARVVGAGFQEIFVADGHGRMMRWPNVREVAGHILQAFSAVSAEDHSLQSRGT